MFFDFLITAKFHLVLSPLRCQGCLDATLTSARFVIATENSLCEDVCLYFSILFCLLHKADCSCKPPKQSSNASRDMSLCKQAIITKHS